MVNPGEDQRYQKKSNSVVRLLYSEEDKTNLENYRPMSLLSLKDIPKKSYD